MRLPVRIARWGALTVATAALACDDGASARSYGAGATGITLRGVGATVPKALFAKWSEQYARVEPGVAITYDPAGSGAGVRVAKDASRDLGVSDSPLSDEDASAHRNVKHLPLAVEAIAVVYALQGAGRLQITEDALADLLQGRTKWWDDPSLALVNPGVKLPHTPVRIVYRADESGSSFLLAEWLSKTTKKWTAAPTRSLSLPTGEGEQKDDGMLTRMRSGDGVLGYVSAVTAEAEHLAAFAVRNPAGRFVSPSLEGMRAAAATAQLGDDLRAHATASPGDLAYPICGFTFGLVQVEGADGPQRRALARFLWWATHDGQQFAPPLGFGALPGELAVRDEDALRSLRTQGEPAL